MANHSGPRGRGSSNLRFKGPRGPRPLMSIRPGPRGPPGMFRPLFGPGPRNFRPGGPHGPVGPGGPMGSGGPRFFQQRPIRRPSPPPFMYHSRPRPPFGPPQIPPFMRFPPSMPPGGPGPRHRGPRNSGPPPPRPFRPPVKRQGPPHNSSNMAPPAKRKVEMDIDFTDDTIDIQSNKLGTAF